MQVWNLNRLTNIPFNVWGRVYAWKVKWKSWIKSWVINFTAHTFNCVCHCMKSMFKVLGVYNFEYIQKPHVKMSKNVALIFIILFQMLVCKVLGWQLAMLTTLTSNRPLFVKNISQKIPTNKIWSMSYLIALCKNFWNGTLSLP